ncbi:hypothetical protein Tco_1362417 [Tanacetum coccineum]
MYHKKNVDYAYLLWEDFVYQVENKNVKRSNETYYPRFTKVIVNFFMTKDSSILRRNRVNWDFAMDDPMFTMIKVVSRHEDTQLYGDILPDELTNEAIKDSESYKEYYVIALGAEPPKTKATKVAKPAKKKQHAKTSKAKGLTVLFKKTSDEEDDDEVAMSGDVDNDSDNQDDNDNDDDDQNDDNTDNENNDNDDDDDGQDHEGQDDDNEQTDLDNNGDDFVHPKFSTHDEKDGSDLRVQPPSHYESTNDKESDEITHGANVEGEELDEEEINEEDEANELYRDMNVNSRVLTYVPVTTIVEPCFLSATILPSPPTPLITHLQQTPVPTPATVLSSPLQDLPNFVSSIPGIVDAYLANKMHEAVKTAVQLQSDILKDEAQAENENFINKLDDNIKKIIKD